MSASVRHDNDWYSFFKYSAVTCCLNICETFSAPRLTSLSALARAYAVKNIPLVSVGTKDRRYLKSTSKDLSIGTNLNPMAQTV